MKGGAEMITKDILLAQYPTDIKNHVKRVADMVKPFGKDYEIVALLHDILEDTDIIYMELLNLFSYDIAEDVLALTRHPSDKYFDYIERITRCGKRPTIIKYYDIIDHLHNKATLKPTLEKRYLKAKKILEEVM